MPILSQSSPVDLWRKRIVLTLTVAFFLAALTVLARAEWESQSFQGAVQQATPSQEGLLRILSSQTFTDSGGYSGSVRQNVVMIVVGGEDELRTFSQHLQASLPSHFVLSVSHPATFTESQSRGAETPETCEVVHITRLRMLDWYDFAQWMD